MGAYIIMFLKGILIGFACGIPIGPVGMLCVQRSSEYGFKKGLVTGVSCSVCDTFYAALTVFGLSFISDFIFKWQQPIKYIGGIAMIIYGIIIILKKSKFKSDVSTNKKELSYTACFLSSFLIGISNPVTILMFGVTLAAYGINIAGTEEGISCVAGIFTGTVIWWFFIAGIIDFFRSKITDNIQVIINRISGSVLIIIAIIVLIFKKA